MLGYGVDRSDIGGELHYIGCFFFFFFPLLVGALLEAVSDCSRSHSHTRGLRLGFGLVLRTRCARSQIMPARRGC